MNERNNTSENYPGEARDVAKLLKGVERRPIEDRERLKQTLERYQKEGEDNSYTSDTTGLRNFIGIQQLLDGVRSLVDLGAGSGDLMAKLAEEYGDKEFVGFDLSPSFTQNFNTNKAQRNTRMRLGLIDSPDAVRDKKLKQGGVISVLTLDRVADPLQLIKNMGQFLGAKILATILPVNPVDDNPSRLKKAIEYTRPEMRITPGASVDEDRKTLLGLLTKMWGSDVQNDTVPYSVTSSGDVQPYTLDVFSKK